MNDTEDAPSQHMGSRQYVVDTLEFAYGPILVAIAYTALIRSDATAEIILAITINTAESLRAIGGGFDLDDLRTVSRGTFGLVTFLVFPFLIAGLLKHVCFEARDQALKLTKTKLHRTLDGILLLIVQVGVLAFSGLVGFAILTSPESGSPFSLEGILLIISSLLSLFAIYIAWLISDLKFELGRHSIEPWRKPKLAPKPSVQEDTKFVPAPGPEGTPSFEPLQRVTLGESGPFGDPSRSALPSSTSYSIPTKPVGTAPLSAENLIDQIQPFLPFILRFGLPIVGAGLLGIWAFLEGVGSFIVSAIGFTTLFLLIFAAFLAFLTSASAKIGSNSVPLIFGMLLLVVLAGSSGAWFWGVLAASIAAIGATRIRNGTLHFAWKMIAVTVLLFGVGKIALPECKTLSGCNLIRGQEMAERPWLDNNTADATDSVSHAFSLWNQPEETTPIRLVAAQGGGLYAAYYTAYYLAARADKEGQQFTESIFAISGVSGGSVGAAVFWSIVKSGVCAPKETKEVSSTCHTDAVDEVLRQDYLSPQFLRFFSLDAIDTVVPISAAWPHPIDRGSRLERVLSNRAAACCAFEEEDAQGEPQIREHHLETPMSGSWAPDAGLPMLFLNATDVHTGTRAIASPVETSQKDGVSTRIALNGDRDLTVANAAVMSARFPFISPAGRIKMGDQTRQLVDGGYFDNSGLVTLHDVLKSIRSDVGKRPIEIIALTIDGSACDGGDDALSCQDRDPRGLIGTPLKTMLSIRGGQEQLAIERFCQSWNDASGLSLAIADAAIEPREFNFTLSWFLSHRTFDNIADQTQATLISPGKLCSGE